MERSEQLNELAPALVKAQAQMKPAREDALNPHLKSKYADLTSVWEACREALTANGLSVAQFAEPGPDGALMLTTMLLHSSGQYLSGTILMPLAKADPQGYGAAMTYARRYGLAAAVGVCPEDDDGHAASQRGASAGSAPRVEQAAPTGPRPISEPIKAVMQRSERDLMPNGTPRQQVASGAFDTSPPEGPKAEAGGQMTCSGAGCGALLTKGQHDVSSRAFGAPLCPSCQKTRARTA